MNINEGKGQMAFCWWDDSGPRLYMLTGLLKKRDVFRYSG